MRDDQPNVPASKEERVLVVFTRVPAHLAGQIAAGEVVMMEAGEFQEAAAIGVARRATEEEVMAHDRAETTPDKLRESLRKINTARSAWKGRLTIKCG